MKASKVYSNKFLFEAYSKVIKRDAGAYTSDEIAEAARIRKKGINIDNVATLVQMSDNDLKMLKGAVHLAEDIAAATNVVPNLCDL